MLKRIALLSAVLATTLGNYAKVKLPQMIGDNMILQQNTNARLWGWDRPGSSIKVTTSWNGKSYQVKADRNGRWLVEVATPKASYTPFQITFDDGDITTIKDVLSGEVWVCAGQSNMEMPVKGFGNCPVEGYNKAVTEARQYSGIHYLPIPSTMAMKPQEDTRPCEWKVIGSETVANASAIGYFFAQVVNKTLDIPVGIIMANKGGTRVESWLDEANLKKYTHEPMDSIQIVKKFSYDYHRPLLWGNGTFHPILNYTVKGIIYYQGCSNVGDPAGQYTNRLKMLVEQWRRDFKLGELPFYFVQIAPYNYGKKDGDDGALLREQQYNASLVIPNSGIICTDDLVYPYESQQIHPAQKQQVGERLAWQALNKTYGMKEIMCESPAFKDFTISNDTCYVHLKNDYNSINRYEDLQGFEVAGEDRVFHKANAYYHYTKGIIITCPEVKKPVTVRYAFNNWGYGNVKNRALLPLFPFRTDNW